MCGVEANFDLAICFSFGFFVRVFVVMVKGT